jgi:cell wall-associated NlpC family hydrolase
MFRYWIGITALMMSTGCATLTPQAGAPVANPKYPALTLKHAPAPLPSSTTESQSATTAAQTSLPANLPDDLKKALQAQHKEWHGTRYRLGGLSRSGVDCSGFVYLTFQERLGMTLPRDTFKQSLQGRDIAKKDLQAGDLVFFRTGRYNHVGIYMDNGQFMHASTRQGVKISRMGDAYWTRTYWKAKRLDLSNAQQLANLQ